MHEIQCCTEPKVYDSLQAPASQTCAGPRFVQRSLGTGLAPKGDVGATNLQEKLLQQISVTEGCTDDGTYRVLGKEPVGESFAPPSDSIIRRWCSLHRFGSAFGCHVPICGSRAVRSLIVCFSKVNFDPCCAVVEPERLEEVQHGKVREVRDASDCLEHVEARKLASSEESRNHILEGVH